MKSIFKGNGKGTAISAMAVPSFGTVKKMFSEGIPNDKPGQQKSAGRNITMQ